MEVIHIQSGSSSQYQEVQNGSELNLYASDWAEIKEGRSKHQIVTLSLAPITLHKHNLELVVFCKSGLHISDSLPELGRVPSLFTALAT